MDMKSKEQGIRPQQTGGEDAILWERFNELMLFGAGRKGHPRHKWLELEVEILKVINERANLRRIYNTTQTRAISHV
jgi:hypothetical protein